MRGSLRRSAVLCWRRSTRSCRQVCVSVVPRLREGAPVIPTAHAVRQPVANQDNGLSQHPTLRWHVVQALRLSRYCHQAYHHHACERGVRLYNGLKLSCDAIT